MPCERCSGPAIGLPVQVKAGNSYGQAFIGFDKAPNARMFKDPYVGHITAWVCRQCGYTTMWVDQHGLNGALQARDRSLGVPSQGSVSGGGAPVAVPPGGLEDDG